MAKCTKCGGPFFGSVPGTCSACKPAPRLTLSARFEKWMGPWTTVAVFAIFLAGFIYFGMILNKLWGFANGAPEWY
jgi:hypothetical protein